MENEQQDFFADDNDKASMGKDPIAEVMEKAEVNTVISETTELEIKQEAKPVVRMAEEVNIVDEASQIAASETLKMVKGSIKKVKERLDPICDASHKAWKANTELRKELTKPFADAEFIIKEKLANYLTEQEEKARKAQAEAEAKARHEEEKQRQKLNERADNWEEKGNEEKAEMLRDEAETVNVTPEVKTPAVTKVKGVSSKEDWYYEVTDITKVPQEYMIVNDKVLSALAKSSKGTIPIPGIKFYSKKNISVRG